MFVDPDCIATVLVRPVHEGNVGAAARALDNLGLADLRLVDAVVLGSDARRMACHALPLLGAARRFASLAEATADCALIVGLCSPARQRGLLLQPLHEVAPQLAAISARRGRIALVFGSEATGLDRADAEHCGVLATLTLAAAHPTLNLAQAVLLTGYELLRANFVQLGAAAPIHRHARAAPLATAAERAQALNALIAALDALGYRRPADAALRARIHRRMRAVIERAGLATADVRMLRALAARVQHRLAATGSAADSTAAAARGASPRN